MNMQKAEDVQDAQSRNCPFTFYAMQMKGSARHAQAAADTL